MRWEPTVLVEVYMKKIVALVGIAAAVYGAKKLFLDKDEQAAESFGVTEYNSNGYTAPQSQEERAA